MNMDWVENVLEFHKKFRPAMIGATPAAPAVDVGHLRMRFVREEFGELEDAFAEHDIPEMADAIADLIYVLIGQAITYGIDIRPVWDAVHAANMAKTAGTRADDKVQKPPGWVAPDVAAILAAQPSLK